ncbi:hypothetical protein ACSFC1_08210 [Pseudothermotoga sp. U03pept]|uniref:hypothetical protein n=1 Tax=Pseudothermotoga sp. U03pept TaxID=3447012 RepID=UPI003F01C434
MKAIKLSSAEKLERITEGLHARKITISGPSTGKAEAHEFQHDLYLAIGGKATVQLGKLTGQVEKLSEGEFRSNEMQIEQEVVLQVGELLLIPAGLGHRVLVDEFYQQWVLKIDAKG